MNSRFYIQNRASLKEHASDQLIVIAAHNEVHRRGDSPFAFVQESNFYYLTGINEAGWKLVIDGARELLVSPERSDVQTLFDGSLTNAEASEASGINEIINQKEWANSLIELKKSHKTVATIGTDPHQKYNSFAPNDGPVNNLRDLKAEFGTVNDIRKVLAKLRSIKQPEEIEVMRKAIAITVDAFNTVKNQLADTKTEAQVSAQLTYDFLHEGNEGHAYDPIVAGGIRACTLHYVKNNAPLKQGSLLLIDAGALHEEYAADITRTYAVGTPSDRQIQVYAAVEKAQQEITALIKPGVALKDYAEQSDVIMKGALRSLGLLNKPDDYRKYFPHAVSHGLGLDVHESLGGYKEFMPGMVLTVEPGIYIPEEEIGVRIEDDILVTEQGNENLSAALPTSL